MMDYEIFKELVAEQFLNYLPAGFKDFGIRLETVHKTNETLDGLAVVPPANRAGEIFPTVYVDHMYDDYVLGENFRQALQNAAEKWVEAYENVPEACRDFSLLGAEKRLMMELVNTEQNREMLAEMPHREFHDLSIIYRLVSGSDSTAVYSTMVSSGMADLMGMDEQQLYEAAFANTREMFPLKVNTMTEILREIFIAEGNPGELADMMIGEMEPEETLYIITNEKRTFGAASILYGDGLQELAESIGTDLYILPSSVHEVIAVSTSVGSAEELARMVCEVNTEQVSPEDRLSDQVYFYDKNMRQLIPAMAAPDRQFGGTAAKTQPKCEAGHSR
jgi:hypothetical protein